ncbi:3-hydroxyacyl-CoA dehydrogenase [Microbacterium sp. C448]|uniref:Rv3235 family protein n=1 Tax=Microbacterium lacus TaxID=415217 RepID=UPI0003DE2BDB|nr:Rv3235 family protein [Microbacterium lacus]CDK00665.1 3-hydroxyacyl-CoA dehydrogenase [Microbacterium sp. C448]
MSTPAGNAQQGMARQGVARQGVASRRVRSVDADEFFSPQRTPSSALPDPEPLITNLARGVMEVFAGVREVDQLARWFAEDAYRRLLTRSNLAARARNARGVRAIRPVFDILSVRHMSPADGVVESVVILAGPHRTRAIALRLEGTDGRWRATSLALL